MANTERPLEVILCDQYFPTSTELRDWRMSLWEEGIAEAGDKPIRISSSATQFGDVCITWGPRIPNIAHLHAVHHVVMECGFLGDRLQNFYVGISGLNGMGKSASPVVCGAGSQWYPQLKELPRRAQHKNVVILGQVAKDANLIPLHPSDQERPQIYREYLRKLADYLEYRGCAVGFRGHPADAIDNTTTAPDVFNFDAANWTKEKIFDWADLAVSFSSNSLVEAFMAGVDVLPAHPGSMCWDVRSGVDHQRYFTQEERCGWLDRLASAQWSAEKIKSGEAWKAIRPAFARSCNQ
jgi:hypothetical protein